MTIQSTQTQAQKLKEDIMKAVGTLIGEAYPNSSMRPLSVTLEISDLNPQGVGINMRFQVQVNPKDPPHEK